MFNVSPQETQIGVVTFSNNAHNNFFLNTYDTQQEVIAAVDRVPFLDQNTNTSGGIFLARTSQFTQPNGDRPDVPNVMIVVTDGESTYQRNMTIPEAMRAQGQGIFVFAIGVTDEVNIQEVMGIASPPPTNAPKDVNYFLLNEFTQLSTFTDLLKQRVCIGSGAVTTVAPPPTTSRSSGSGTTTTTPPVPSFPPPSGGKTDFSKDTVEFVFSQSPQVPVPI